jgi:PKD repeat protein
VSEGSHIKTFEWDFGDGATATGVDVAHVYNSEGNFEVKLKVTDDKELSHTATHQIQISGGDVPPDPVAPVAVINGPAEADAGEIVVFDAGNSVCETTCVSYAWDLGDGTTANAVSIQHQYSNNNTYNVVLVVTDDRGLEGRANHQILIVEEGPPEPTAAPPTPEPTEEPPTPEPTEEPQPEPPAAQIEVNGQLVPEGGVLEAQVEDPLAFSCEQSLPGEGNKLAKCRWDFGDGTGSDKKNETHAYTQGGQFIVTLTAVNSQGLEDVTTMTVSVPEAVNLPAPQSTDEAGNKG